MNHSETMRMASLLEQYIATQMAIELFRLDPDHETTKNVKIMEFYYEKALDILRGGGGEKE